MFEIVGAIYFKLPKTLLFLFLKPKIIFAWNFFNLICTNGNARLLTPQKI